MGKDTLLLKVELVLSLKFVKIEFDDITSSLERFEIWEVTLLFVDSELMYVLINELVEGRRAFELKKWIILLFCLEIVLWLGKLDLEIFVLIEFVLHEFVKLEFEFRPGLAYSFPRSWSVPKNVSSLNDAR